MKKNLTKLNVVWLIVFCALWLPALALGQHRPSIDVQEWPKGKVVLTNGDTLYGALTYYRTQEIVNLAHSDGSLTSLSPVNVEYFVAQEMPSGRSIVFRTLAWDLGRSYSDFKKPTFFEELNQGMLTLIMRESYIRRDANNISPVSRAYGYEGNYYSPSERWADQVKMDYYILLPDGDIVALRNIKKDLHSLFGKRSKEVKSYVKLNKLDYERPHELIAIVNYFNALTSTTSLAN